MNQESPSQPVLKSRRGLSPFIFDILLIYILLAGAYFRFVGINWGEYQYLHPDERFLIWVGTDIAPVEHLGDYFNTATSSLNPHNRGHTFYVYGTLPMFLARYMAEWVFGRSGFQEMTDVGRLLSALADLLTVFLVYLIAARVYDRRAGLLAAAFIASAVLPIQQAHFFTMDTFANFFTLLAIYYAIRVASETWKVTAYPAQTEGKSTNWQVSLLTNFIQQPHLLPSLGFGIALGCAVASKINAVPVALMLPLAFGLTLWKLPAVKRWSHLNQAIGFVAVAALTSVIIFRIFQPYAFSGPGFFGLQLNPSWVSNIVEQRNQAAGDVDFPPALQWARRPIWFSFQNLTVWGLGLPLGLLAWAGFLWAAWRIYRRDWQRHVLLWGWTALYFTWQSLQFNPTMRYQLPIYPTLAIFAGWAVVELYDRFSRGIASAAKQSVPGILARGQLGRWLTVGIGGAVLGLTLAYAFAFTRIYVRPITRVEASRWIYQNIPGAINLHLETEAGLINRPLPFPYGGQVTSTQPYTTIFTPATDGALREIYLPDIWDIHSPGGAAVLDLTLSLLPNGEQPLEYTSAEVLPSGVNNPNSQSYLLEFNQQPLLVKDQVYYLTITTPTNGKILDLCGPATISLATPTETIEQALDMPVDCVLQNGISVSLVYTAPADGQLHSLTLSQVIDLSPAPGEKTLKATFSPSGNENLVATAAVTANFSPANDGTAHEFTLTFDQPIQVKAGESYRLALVVEGEGVLTLQGAGLANEGEWDDGLPLRMDGLDGFGGIFPRELNFNMYWDDNPEKLARFLNIYDRADYIVMTSNRQWGVLPRLPERFPMTALHYRHLLGCPDHLSVEYCYRVAQPGMFQGDFGFELVQIFQSDPSLGPIRINTQFAEEAFTVYDHPKVLIFRKTENYDPQKVASVLGNVDFSQIVRVTPKKAESYPATLTLPAERLAEQRLGGTWSELFDTGSLLNSYPALGLLAWYLSVGLLGILTYPLLRLALPGLEDRGYPLARTGGMLLLAYLVWLAGSARIPFSQPTISLGLGLILVTSGLVAYARREDLRREWQERRSYFLLIEGLALAFFIFFLLIRLGNPDLWHPWKGGEKPMDFSYFNAVLKSTSFPPYDPWFADGYLNYYYFGFVLVGVLVKWLGIVPSVAYNLILPTLFSMVAIGAFSVAYNLYMAGRKARAEPDGDVSSITAGNPGVETSLEDRAQLPTARLRWQKLDRSAIVAGMAGALGMVVLGNLGTLRMILRGYQQLAIPGGLTEDTGLVDRILGTFKGLWMSITGASLPYGVGDWYWIPSRAIPAPGEVEPITEFPFFTFLYADPHAHMYALPLALLSLAWAAGIVLLGRRWAQTRSPLQLTAMFALGGLAIGALRPTNTWDFYSYLAIGLVAVIYALWRYAPIGSDSFQGTLLAKLPVQGKRAFVTVIGAVTLAGLALLFYQPYAQWYGQGYNEIELWKGTHTPTTSYLVHWGLFLFVIVSWMAWESREWMAQTPLRALRKLEPQQGLILVSIVLLVIWVLLFLWLNIWIAWLAIPLAAWAGVLLLRPGMNEAKRILLFLTGTGLVLTLMVEGIVLKGDIGRMNTVFKFYLQVWTLLAVCAGAGVGWLLQGLKRWSPNWRLLWQVAFTALVASAALFTMLGSFAKIRDRIAPSAPHTLDGLAYMPYSTYNESGTVIDLSQDYDAIRWMQENITGSPVIVEANSGNLYRWYTRYTINTGLPGVVGWEWHQQQQRAINPGEWVSRRLRDINLFYLTLDMKEMRQFLERYDVSYIVVGQLEKITYPGPGLEKFPDFNGVLWREVYADGDTAIYEVIR